MKAALVFLLFLFPLTVVSLGENATTVVDDPEAKNITEDVVPEVKKIVLYGRIFCAQQQGVHSRQKRFNSLSDLYSAHGYSGPTPNIQMRSDDDDEVVSDWERLSNQIKNNDHQRPQLRSEGVGPQLRSGGKLHRSSDYYPTNNYHANNYPSYPSSGEHNYQPYYQQEHYEPEESYSSEEESHFAQYPTEEYQKGSGEYQHVPKHQPKKEWEGKPQKETWSDKQQQEKTKPVWEKEEKPKPDWEKEEKPKPDWEKPVQVVKGEWNGQPTEHHHQQPQTPQIPAQAIGWNEPKKESEQQAAVKPVEVEHPQKTRQSNVLQAQQFNGFNQQQSGALPPTTHLEHMELANNDWAIDPFISGGAGLTRAEQQEQSQQQEQQQSNQQNGSPKWSQPIESRRQRRSADEPAVPEQDKHKIDLEPVKKAFVTAYQSKIVGFSRVNEPIARAETNEEGYFRLEITLDENEFGYSTALPYFSVAHQCPNAALPKLEEDCRYINYQPFDQASFLSEENAFAKVVILGVGDQKQTIVRCPLNKEAPSFMNE